MNKSGKNADPSLIDWAAREAKIRSNALTRSFMLPLLLGVKKNIKCLSLPGARWRWETELAGLFPKKHFEFFGVESHAKVWEQMTKGMPKVSNADFYHARKPMTLRTALQDMNVGFDLIYADYMGTWSMDKVEDIRVLFDNQALNFQGYLVMSLSLCNDVNTPAREMAMDAARGRSDIMVIDDLEEAKELGLTRAGNGPRLRSIGIPLCVEEIASNYGMRLRNYPPHIYYNKHDGNYHLYPEASLVFRRIK